MAQVVDVVVIGAGINGASIAFNLAKKGCRSVVLLEKHIIASGGTGKSAALIRQHYSNEVLVKIAKRCRNIFEQFQEVVGGECGFVKTGYLFFVPNELADRFHANIAMQQRLGVVTGSVSREEAQSIAPSLNVDDSQVIAYEPGSGFADPYETTVSYIQRARELGVVVRQSSPVRVIRLAAGRIEGVATDKEEFATRVVVNVAGPWANDVGSMVKVKYPIQVTREQEVLLRPAQSRDCPTVTVSDMCNAIYFHPLGKELLVGRGFPKEYEEVDPDNYPEPADQQFIEDIAHRVVKRVPRMVTAMCIRGYSGLYDVTPDWHPIIGCHPEVPGFISCVGFSGHGFKLGPVVGEAVAELVLEGKARDVELELFAPDRFARGRQFTAAYGGNRA